MTVKRVMPEHVVLVAIVGVASGLSAEVKELAEGIAHEAAGDPKFRRLVRKAARALIAAALHQRGP
jgi:hypothetical protein